VEAVVFGIKGVTRDHDVAAEVDDLRLHTTSGPSEVLLSGGACCMSHVSIPKVRHIMDESKQGTSLE
jgi:hypothetical protein